MREITSANPLFCGKKDLRGSRCWIECGLIEFGIGDAASTPNHFYCDFLRIYTIPSWNLMIFMRLEACSPVRKNPAAAKPQRDS